MKALSTAFCAFGAAFGLAISASAETETIAYWPFGTNGFNDVSGNGHHLEGVEIAESDAAYVSLNDGRTDQALREILGQYDEYSMIREIAPVESNGPAAMMPFIPAAASDTKRPDSSWRISGIYCAWLRRNPLP